MVSFTAAAGTSGNLFTIQVSENSP